MVKVSLEQLQLEALKAAARGQRLIWTGINERDPGNRQGIFQLELWDGIISALEAATPEDK